MVLSSKISIQFIKDPHNYAKAQQHGIDLTIQKLLFRWPHESDPSLILRDKTIVSQSTLTTPEPAIYDFSDGKEGWLLAPGYFEIVFDQGVKVPENCKANIIHRSSLARSGAWIMSAEYDPGFETEFAGAFMLVHEPIFIEEHARVAQIIFQEIKGDVEQYAGQWQGK